MADTAQMPLKVTTPQEKGASHFAHLIEKVEAKLVEVDFNEEGECVVPIILDEQHQLTPDMMQKLVGSYKQAGWPKVIGRAEPQQDGTTTGTLTLGTKRVREAPLPAACFTEMDF